MCPHAVLLQVGPLAFDALHSRVVAAAHAGEAGAEQHSQLLAAVQSIVPPNQLAVVLPLLVKLVYLETQLDEPGSAAS